MGDDPANLHGHGASVWGALLADPARVWRTEGRFFAEPEEALPVALALTRDPRPAVRARICRFLGNQDEELPGKRWRLRPDVRAALEALVEDTDEFVRTSADAALAMYEEMDDRRPRWCRLRSGLANPRLDVRFRAAVGLKSLCDPDEILPTLLETLRGGDVDLRRQAAATLGIEESCWARDLRGSRAEVVVPALVEALDDPEPDVVFHAAIWGIHPIGEPAAPAVPVLRRLLASENHEIRQAAVIALGGIGRPAAVAVKEIRAALTDPDEHVREAAARALSSLEDSDS